MLVLILDPFPEEADMQNLHTVQWFCLELGCLATTRRGVCFVIFVGRYLELSIYRK